MILHAPIHPVGYCCHRHATHSWPAVPPSIRGQAQRAAHLLVRSPSRQAGAASSLLAEQACGTQDSSTVAPARGADKQASPWAQLPGHPRGYRCRLCFETDFSTRGHLAEHLVGRKHAGAWTGQQHICPYCGKAHSDAGGLREHVRSACLCVEDEDPPARYTRYARQRNYNMDPRYEALLDVETDLGRVVIRPMHRQHIFETALVATEAFLVDRNPPEFQWMLDDLERICADYERDPAPILRHDPNISEQLTTSLAAPSGLGYKDKADLYRIQTEEAWGRWLWLVAELIPHDAALLPKGQDTRVVGATALMFHDRRATLSKMKRLRPPLQTSQVDYSLWLSRSPPEGLEHQRAAFIWWTSTHYKMRRKGVAQALVRACEGVAAAANFLDIYIQAAVISRDSSSLLGGWLSQEYQAARETYARAGYVRWTPEKSNRLVPWATDVDTSAELMYKQLHLGSQH